jgi:hypothetical protein
LTRVGFEGGSAASWWKSRQIEPSESEIVGASVLCDSGEERRAYGAAMRLGYAVVCLEHVGLRY